MKGLGFASGPLCNQAAILSPLLHHGAACLNRRLVESSRGLYKHSTQQQVNKAACSWEQTAAKPGNAAGAVLSPGGRGWDGGVRNGDGERHLPHCWGSCMGRQHQHPDYASRAVQVEKPHLEMKR